MSCSWQFASKLTFSRGGHTHDLKPFHAHPREMLPGCMQLNMLSSNPTVKSLLNSAFPPFAVLHARLYFFLFHVKKEHPCCHPAPPSCSFSKPSCDENSSFFVVVFFNFTWKSSQLGRGLVRKKRSRKQFKCVTKLKLLEPQWTRFSSSLFPPVWVSNSTYVDVRARVFIRNFGLIWILGHDKIKHVLTFITYLVTYSYK